MASGLSPQLPLVVDEVFGAYNLNTDYKQVAIQNLKMLVLTNPGERMMNPDFGAGVRRFFFENNDRTTYNRIAERIYGQAATYMQFIQINNITFNTPENNPDLFPNTIAIEIQFTIIPLQISTSVLIPVSTN